MTNAILLAVALAIVAFNILRGRRGYLVLAAANAANRSRLFRRIIVAQIVMFAVPTLIGIALLDRWEVFGELPYGLWDVALSIGSTAPYSGVDRVLIVTWSVSALIGLVVGSALTWWRHSRGHRPKVPTFVALLPRNRQEVILLAGVSIAAGTCEELFFRLLLPMLLAAYLSGAAALMIATGLFAALHFYQGWKGVVLTGLVGMVLSGMYLLTGSILLVIVLHTAIDIMGLVIRPVIRGAWTATAAD